MKYKTVYISVVAKIMHILLLIGIVLTGAFTVLCKKLLTTG